MHKGGVIYNDTKFYKNSSVVSGDIKATDTWT
jgi:hypothetical protein